MIQRQIYNADWHQLLELCALFDTLIADADGIQTTDAIDVAGRVPMIQQLFAWHFRTHHLR